MRFAFAIAAVVAYFLALHALNHPKGWARAARALWGALRAAGAWSVRAPDRQPPVSPQDALAHPGVSRRRRPLAPPLDCDGQPLSDEEARILGRVEMDSMIGIPEPRNGGDR